MLPMTAKELQDWLFEIYRDPNTGLSPRLIITPFAYPIAVTGLAQGATVSGSLAISANADFVWLSTAYRASTGAAQNASTKTAAFIRALFVDTGTNEQFTNQAIDLEDYANNLNDSRPLPYPRFIAGKSAISWTFTNFAPVAETYAFEFAMHGVLVRALSGSAR